MKKNIKNLTLGLVLAAGSLSGHAASFDYHSTLTIGAGSELILGSLSQPGGLASFIPAPLTGLAGLELGSSQATGVTTPGGATATTIGSSIDQWNFFGLAGLDFTSSPTNVLSYSGNTATVDFSGWHVTWNGIPGIDLGGNPAVGGQAWGSDPLVASTIWAAGNTNGVAHVTFGSDGHVGDTYTLIYTATVPTTGPAGFVGQQYGLELKGFVAAPVPVPAAVWMVGSALVGLVGVSRRKKAA